MPADLAGVQWKNGGWGTAAVAAGGAIMSIQSPLLATSRSGGDLEAADGAPSPKPRQRLSSLDLLRGLIMAVMAWDHTREGVVGSGGPKNHGDEMWSGELATYDDKWYFYIARAVSHFCMPGFFYLMGIGMALFSLSRIRRGWKSAAIFRHFCTRGCLLIFFGRIVQARKMLSLFEPSACPSHHHRPSDVPKWLGDIVHFYQVLTSLGVVMLICGAAIPLITSLQNREGARWYNNGTAVALSLTVISFVLSNLLITSAQGADPGATCSTSHHGGNSSSASWSAAEVADVTQQQQHCSTAWPGSDYPASTFGEVLLRYLVYPGLMEVRLSLLFCSWPCS